jgi:serine protease
VGTELRAWAVTILMSLTLAACGGGGGSSSPAPQPRSPSPAPVPAPSPAPPSSENTYTVSGQIVTDPLLDVDADINDPRSQNTSNDDFPVAQLIDQETEVRGFVTRSPTFDPGDAFANESDELDVYVADLSSGQQISLTIFDFGTLPPNALDLDLYLFDAEGQLITSSNAFSARIEQITVSSAGRYFIVVEAFAGRSNYGLTIIAAPETGPQVTAQTDLASLSPERVTVLDRARARARSAALREIGETPKRTSRFAGRAGDNARSVQQMRLLSETLIPASKGPLSLDFPKSGLGLSSSHGSDPRYARKLALLDHVKQVNAKAGAEVIRPYHYPRTLASPPPDPSLQWNLGAIEWQQGLTAFENRLPAGRRPVIAVLDSGIFSSHPEIAPALIDERDFVPSYIDGDGFDAEAEESPLLDEENTEDCFDFHGTHVSSIAVAPRAGSIGGRNMIGVAPDAELIAIKLGYARGEDCGFIVGDVAGAIRYAAGLPNSSGELPPRPADVINMSFGTTDADPATRAAIQDAVEAGVIVVASAGNEGDEDIRPAPTYPAAFPEVFAVAGTDIEGRRAPYSSFYPQVEIAAPGGDGRSDRNGDGLGDGIVGAVARLNAGGTGFVARYALYQGTSMAAPHVAAGFGLMKALYSDLDTDMARRLLEDGRLTSDVPPEGRDEETGFGLMSLDLMARAAIELSSGELDLAPDFAVLPNEIELGFIAERATITVSRRGDPDFSITAVRLLPGGLPQGAIRQTRAIDTDPRGFGSYEIGIFRSLVPEGSYALELEVLASNGSSKSVPVNFRVPARTAAAQIGPARFVLERREANGTFTELDRQPLPENSSRLLELSGIPEGTYRIRFTTDLDNDGEICDPGELGGAWPGQRCDSAEAFTVSGDVTGAEFVIGRLPD